MIHISTSFALLVVAIIILVCIAGSRLSGRLGVPTLFIFIMLGMLFGSDGIFKIPFGNFALAEQVCSVALIFIMFYGGFGTRWSEAKPVAGRSILLSSVGVVLTALLTGLFCHLVLNMALMEGMLLGAVLGSTDAASVFSILRSRKLNLKYGTASMLELESGSNDPFAYMMTGDSAVCDDGECERRFGGSAFDPPARIWAFDRRDGRVVGDMAFKAVCLLWRGI